MTSEEKLDHPCKQTCSGWKQGYEKGALAGEALLREAEGKVERLRFALQKAKDDIEKCAKDTLWHGPVETTVDMIDAALESVPPGAGEVK